MQMYTERVNILKISQNVYLNTLPLLTYKNSITIRNNLAEIFSVIL